MRERTITIVPSTGKRYQARYWEKLGANGTTYSFDRVLWHSDKLAAYRLADKTKLVHVSPKERTI